MKPSFPGAAELRPTRADLRAVIQLALPVMGVQLGVHAMGLVDTLMVGRVSAEDLAAVALGNILFFSITVFGMGVIMSLDPLVSQAVGAGDREGAARAVQRGLILSVALGVVAALCLLPAGPLLRFARQPGEVIPLAAGYALWSIPGVVPLYLFLVFRQSLQAMGRVTPILWTALFGNLVNAFLNWVFIWGNLGVSPLGAVGSAIASSLSRTFLAVTLLVIAWPLLRSVLRPRRQGIFAVGPLARMARLGAPIGLQFQFEFGAFAFAGLLMGLLGTVALAGHQVAINLASFAFMIPMGISAAAAVRVGQEVGRGSPERARGAAGASLLVGGSFMAVVGALFLLFPGALGRLFSADPAVVAVVAVLVPIAGVFQVADGLQAVAGGVLRGVGDTRSPMLANLVGFWVLGLPLAALLAFRFALGPAGLWWGLAAGLAIVSILLVLRVRSRLGGELRRMVVE